MSKLAQCVIGLGVVVMAVSAQPTAVNAKDDTGGGGPSQRKQCKTKAIFGGMAYYCDSGYLLGHLNCEIDPLPAPGASNSCIQWGACGGNPWPVVGLH